MHKFFNYPIECVCYSGCQFESVEFKEENGRELIVPGKFDGVYMPFYEIDLIPSLVTAVEKVLNGVKKENQIQKWICQWGMLKQSEQTVDEFWYEAEKLHDLWKLYQAITLRDLDYLKSVSEVKELTEDDLDYNVTLSGEKEPRNHIYSFFDNRYKRIEVLHFFRKKQELKDYQNAAIQYLVENIKPYIANGTLSDLDITRRVEPEEDIYKVTPCMEFIDLIDALYMQFFILISENVKKICITCNTPFVPKRKDRKYCTSTCYNTAKTRRYRSK